MKTFTLTLAWGQSDEGLYHWAGQAESLEAATQAAREEMDARYNEDYCKGEYPCDARGEEAGEPTTEYELVDAVEGYNEFAAGDMLKALRAVRARINGVWDDPDLIEFGPLTTTNEDILRMVEPAIARGEGRA